MADFKSRLDTFDPNDSVLETDLLYTEKANHDDAKTSMQQIKDFVYPPVADTQTSGLISTTTQAVAGKKTFQGGVATSTLETSGQTTLGDDATVNGDLHVNGNIIQQGHSYETEVETLAVKDEIIKTRDGATTGMASGEYTGLQAEKYDGSHDGRLVFGADGVARVGDYTPASGDNPAVDDTQPLATREENPTDGALQVWDSAHLSMKSIAKGTSGHVLTSNGPDSAPSFQALSAIALEPLANMLYPVGFVYTQYPGCPSPIDMNLIGTWQELKFGGMFFRSAGGNARDFTDAYAASVSGTTVTFTGDSIPYTGDSHKKDGVNVGDLIIAGSEYRTVTAVTTDGDYAVSVTIDSAFSDSTNITTVYIGQHEGAPNITGTFSAGPTNIQISSGAFSFLDNTTANWYGGSSSTKTHWKYDASSGETKSDRTYKNDVYGKNDHLTPNAITLKLWKRVG